MAASKLAQQAKARYEAYIGYAYGKKKASGRGTPKMYQELAGKKFCADDGSIDWEKLVEFNASTDSHDARKMNFGAVLPPD